MSDSKLTVDHTVENFYFLIWSPIQLLLPISLQLFYWSSPPRVHVVQKCPFSNVVSSLPLYVQTHTHTLLLLECSFSFSSTHFHSNDLYGIFAHIKFCVKHFWYALFCAFFPQRYCHCQNFIDVRWFYERKGECAKWSQEGNRKRIENIERGARCWNTADIFEVNYQFFFVFHINIDNF